MKRKLSLILLLFLFINPTYIIAKDALFDETEDVYIIEQNTGDVLFSQSADTSYNPSDSTKLMTALILVEEMKDSLGKSVMVGEEIQNAQGDTYNAHLYEGQIVSYTDLLYALLLPSGNDAAYVIATNVGKEIAGSKNITEEEAIDAFVDKMNEKAQELGLSNTHFTNPTGYYDPDQVTTLEEMSKIASEFFANNTLINVLGMKSYSLKNEDDSTNTIKNLNQNIYKTSETSEEIETVEEPEITEELTEDTLDETEDVSLEELEEDLAPKEEIIKENTEEKSLSTGNNAYTTNIVGGIANNLSSEDNSYVFYSEINDANIIGIINNPVESDVYTQAKNIVNDLEKNYDFNSWTNENGFYQEFDNVDNIHFSDGSTINLTAKEELKSFINTKNQEDYTFNLVWDSNYVEQEGDNLRLIQSIDTLTPVANLEIVSPDGITKSVNLYSEKSLDVKNWKDTIVANLWWIILLVIFLLIVWRLIYVHNRRKAIRRRRQRARRRAMMQKSTPNNNHPRTTTNTRKRSNTPVRKKRPVKRSRSIHQAIR